MAKTQVVVLGAGIVGVSAALQLARRGVAVALVDRGEPGRETSYGNAGVIGLAGVFPVAFPRSWRKLARVALKKSTEANYHLAALPTVLPWLAAYWRQSSPARLEANGRALWPLRREATAEHELLLAEAGAARYLRKSGWISIYRDADAFAHLAAELALGEELGLPAVRLDGDGARALEPGLAPVFARAIHWPSVVSVSDPLAVTRAYAARLEALGGIILRGEARSLHRSGSRWRVETAEGPVDAAEVVVALGPWAGDFLAKFDLRLPLAVKRGYHRHFKPRGEPALTRPVLDADWGYVAAPMAQGLRLSTGAEFAGREAPPTPVQFARLLPHARALLPLGERADDVTWMGCRPCLADSLPVIGRAPGQPGLWLAVGHGHLGLSLAPITGRLLAEMITGAATVVDPAPYRAERFAA